MLLQVSHHARYTHLHMVLLTKVKVEYGTSTGFVVHVYANG